jgi:(p)ppGpp synthase/HD superfamily hydrolase
MSQVNEILRHANLSTAQNERIQPAVQAFSKNIHAAFAPDDEKRILNALALMLELHRDQKPRPDGAPYIEHPLTVAAGVLDAMAQKDPELVIAALLHDTVEDQAEKLVEKATAEEKNARKDQQKIALAVIKRETGSKRIKKIVAGLSNPDFKAILKARGVQRRKDEAGEEAYQKAKNALYAEHVREMFHDPDVALIKLFDFTTNALALDGISNAETRKKYARKYGAAIESIIASVRDNKPPLNLRPEMREGLLARLLVGREMLLRQGEEQRN